MERILQLETEAEQRDVDWVRVNEMWTTTIIERDALREMVDPDLLGKYHDLSYTLTLEREKTKALIDALERAMNFTAESETRANIAEDLRRITSRSVVSRPDAFDQALAGMNQDEIGGLPSDAEVNDYVRRHENDAGVWDV